MNSYLQNQIKLARYYKSLGDAVFAQLNFEELTQSPNKNSNSVAVIAKHISGNMLSRWTDFLTTDGEKEWRNRDDEFTDSITSKQELIAVWEKGWACFFDSLSSLTGADLDTVIYIRNEGHSVTDAVSRQMAHYPYHIGQIVFLAKMIKKSDWKSLSIGKGKSSEYNKGKFDAKKSDKHFTDEV